MIAIDCNGLFLLIFEEKWPNYASGPKFAPNSNSFWVRRLLSVCVRQMRQFCLFTYSPKSNWASSEKMNFFAKIGIFCKSIAGPLYSVVQAYTEPYSFSGRIKLIICGIRHELSVTIHEISISWKNVRWRTIIGHYNILSALRPRFSNHLCCLC